MRLMNITLHVSSRSSRESRSEGEGVSKKRSKLGKRRSLLEALGKLVEEAKGRCLR